MQPYRAQTRPEKEGRRKELKDFQESYVRTKLSGLMEEDWVIRVRDLIEMAEDYEISEDEIAYLLRYSLRDHARQNYNQLIKYKRT